MVYNKKSKKEKKETNVDKTVNVVVKHTCKYYFRISKKILSFFDKINFQRYTNVFLQLTDQQKSVPIFIIRSNVYRN